MIYYCDGIGFSEGSEDAQDMKSQFSASNSPYLGHDAG